MRALSSELDLEVVETRYRGHASKLSGKAASDGFGLILTLGGDGTVNEAVNGIMGGPTGPRLVSSGPRAAGPADAGPADAGPADPGLGSPDSRPALAAIPGGSANVFSRALGLPPDPVDATGRILDALLRRHYRRIGLGRAAGRYFAFNAGLGFDAEVVRAIEGLRADGAPATAVRYVWTAVRHFFMVTDRRHPALTVEPPGQQPTKQLFLCIVSNTAPWTFLGHRPLNPSPEANFDSGLDVFALKSLGTVRTLATLRLMLSRNGPPRGRSVLALHDQRRLTILAQRPIAFQVDGEYVGEAEAVNFTSVPGALRVLA